MKNEKSNLILEKYSRPLLGWNENVFKKAVERMLRRMCVNIAKEFDGHIIPRNIFSFKGFFDHIDDGTLEVNNPGIENCSCEFQCTRELSEKESKILLLGSPKEPKYGGIGYNNTFRSELKRAGIYCPKLEGEDDPKEPEEPERESEEDPDKEPEEGDEVKESISYIDFLNAYKHIVSEADDAPEKRDGFAIKQVTIEFKDISIEWVDPEKSENTEGKDNGKAKPFKRRDYMNPNYIKSLKGNIYMCFNGSDGVSIGTIAYYPKRTKDMDPPKVPDLRQSIKNLWNDTMKEKTDFGVAGVAAKTLAKDVLRKTWIANAFSEVVQYERTEVKINTDCLYQKNLKKVSDIKSDSRHAEQLSSNKNKALNANVFEYLKELEGKKYQHLYLNFTLKTDSIVIGINEKDSGTEIGAFTIRPVRYER